MFRKKQAPPTIEIIINSNGELNLLTSGKVTVIFEQNKPGSTIQMQEGDLLIFPRSKVEIPGGWARYTQWMPLDVIGHAMNKRREYLIRKGVPIGEITT